MTNQSVTSEPVARLLSSLQGVERNGHGWMANCPAHDDRTPSLSIRTGEDGCALLHCFGGCPLDAITAALKIKTRDLFAQSRKTDQHRPLGLTQFHSAEQGVEAYRAKLGPEDSRWVYRSVDGSEIGLVLRWNRDNGAKTYRPIWRIGTKWQQTYPAERPLYALDRLAAAAGERVFVVEGEKCADMLATLGFVATTSPGGAQGASRASWKAIAGRDVLILPDADEPGRKYAEDVRTAIAANQAAARTAVINLPGLDLREDVVEFVNRVHGGDHDAARRAIEVLASGAFASTSGSNITLTELLRDPSLRRKPETIPSGWTRFDRAQPFEAIERGAKVVLSAPPGCFKTATMLRMARGFLESGHRVAWLAAEMQPRALARRLLCQTAGLGQAALLSESMPPDHARRFKEAEERLANAPGRIEFTTAPIGFDELNRAADGADIVFLDYLQLLQNPNASIRGNERIEDAMAAIAHAAQRTGASFIMAAAQGRDGGGEARDLHNAVRGSSAVEFTVDALYSATAPTETQRRSGNGFTVMFRCLKQREGALLPIEVAIDGRTGAIAEDPAS